MSELQSVISSCHFVDLYVSNSFADVKGLAGFHDSRMPVPESWEADVKIILGLCRAAQLESGDPEFSIVYDGVIYRVTHLDSNEVGGTYVLRKSTAELRDFRSLGIPTHFIEAVLAPKAAGILLICGGFGVGKTSTAASFVVAVLENHGGVALAIEDPNETAISGVHGKGRCIAIAASRQKGGYKEHLLRGLRSGADLIFLGEIRDSDTAYEALKAGSNGELIVATMHAGSVQQVLERLISLASEHTSTADKLLADSLLGVIWQDLSIMPRQGGGDFKRLTVETLLVDGDMASGIKEKIRHGQIPSLTQEIEQQAQRGMWLGTKHTG